MTETFTDSGALVTWSTPQCPFVIEYSRKALDDIRLAVVDAFFSLPRGGAEIGGILLGRFEEPRLQILDYAPLECEHAFGPAFTLSPKDQMRLSEMLAEASQRHPGLQVVGWYHSHTRSEISLCDADLEIHNHYFPERWHVALVLRPSTLQPTQAGFFFREPDGSIRSQSSYQEFTLETLPVRPLPTGVPVAVPGPVHETAPDSVVITMPSAEAFPPASAPPMISAAETTPPAIAPFAPEALPQPWADGSATGAPEHQDPPVTSSLAPAPPASVMETAYAGTEHTTTSDLFFRAPEREASRGSRTERQLTSESWAPADEPVAPAMEDRAPVEEIARETPRPGRRWVGVAAGVFAGIALGVVVDQARSHVVQPPALPPQAVQTPAPVAGSLRAADAALRKQNDELSKQNTALTAEISGLRKQNTDLLKQQGLSGTEQQAAISKQQAGFEKQQAELRQQKLELNKQQAELTRQQTDLARQQADSNKRQSATAQQQTTLAQQEGQLRQQRDDLARQTAKLKADLSAQTARAQSLQQQVEELRRQAQRRRLSVQSTDQLP